MVDLEFVAQIIKLIPEVAGSMLQWNVFAAVDIQRHALSEEQNIALELAQQLLQVVGFTSPGR